MADPKKRLPNKRTTTLIIVVLFLLAFFLVPYLFFFIPSNESTLQQQAFLKLMQGTKNIINKDIDSKNYFKYTKTTKDSIAAKGLNGLGCNREDSVYFTLYNSDGWHIFYRDSSRADSPQKGPTFYYGHDLPISDFVRPCVASSKELFQSLFLVDYCTGGGKDTAGTIIYQDIRAGLEPQIAVDSLIPRKKGIRSPDIIDISLEGTAYKMFTYPFGIGRHRLILCGLLKRSEYNARLHVMPVWIVYTLLISLSLFILSLPFLKIFMMNDQDRVYKDNLVNGSRFLFATATFVTLVVVQLFLLWKGNREVQNNLRTLSQKMGDSLSVELNQAKHQMVSLDAKLKNYLETGDSLSRKQTDAMVDSIKNMHGKIKTGTGKVKEPYLVNITTDSSYQEAIINSNNKFLIVDTVFYNYFDQAGWINSNGKESIRTKFFNKDSLGSLKATKYKGSFVDVRERDYYKNLKNIGIDDSIPDNILMIAPVYSWANKEFRVNICRRTTVPGMFIQVLQTRLYSLLNTALTAGYGFCLIQDDGKVLIHSDTLKSLRENFLEETGQLRWIKEAIASRQIDSSYSVPFYGKWYSLRVQPLKQHPLFLVTFYDNSYMAPVNVRILAFSILFCCITYGLLYVLTLFLYLRPARSFLFSPIDYFDWLVPRRHLVGWYFNSCLLICVYILILLVSATVIVGHLDDFDYAILFVTVLTPFNLLFALRLLRRSKAPKSTKRAIINISVPLAAAVVVFLISGYYHHHHQSLSSFGIVEGMVILLMAAIAWKNGFYWYFMSDWLQGWIERSKKWKKIKGTQKKMFSYSCFIALFITAMAIVPAAVYNWFAYRHESVESVKKEQLNVAKNLEKRDGNVKYFLKTVQPDFAGTNDSNYINIQYKKGIYSIYDDSITYGRETLVREADADKHNLQSEPFYQDIASTIGVNYEDPTFLPALKDSVSEDNLWHWDVDKDTSFFDYSSPKWIMPLAHTDLSSPGIYLRITSVMPPPTNGAAILFLLILIVTGLYMLVRTLIKQLFLLKIIGEIEEEDPGDPGIWENCFDELDSKSPVKSIFTNANDIRPLLEKEYEQFKVVISSDIVGKEMEYTKRAGQLRPLFDGVWGKCTDQERFLLYGLAVDGLINHKNEALIYKLFRDKLLVVNNERIKLISYSFRQYIISKRGTEEEKVLLEKLQSGGSWNFMRTIFAVVILSILVFLFLTQQEVSGQIIALVTGLATIIPLLLKFASGGGDSAGKN